MEKKLFWAHGCPSLRGREAFFGGRGMSPFAALSPGALWGTACPRGTADSTENVRRLGQFPLIPRVCQVFPLSLGFLSFNSFATQFLDAVVLCIHSAQKIMCRDHHRGQHPLAAAKLKQLLFLQISLAEAVVLFLRGEK